MKKIVPASAVTIFFLLVVISCKKSSNPFEEPIVIQFSQEALEYVRLDAGKYLIYEDSATGDLDSVVVIKAGTSWVVYQHIPGDIFSPPSSSTEQYSILLTKFTGTAGENWFSGEASATSGGQGNGSTSTADLTLFETYATVSGIAFFYSEQTPVNVIPSISLKGTTYTNVIVGVWEYGTGINDPTYTKRTFYWAKGIGIVKREIISSGGAIKTHTLLRHN